MARATGNMFNPQVLGTGADGDAVIAGFDGGTLDDNVSRELDVDAVGVGAVAVGDDFNSLNLNVGAGIYHNVEHLAV